MRIGIVGLGVIGGSLARALVDEHVSVRASAVDASDRDAAAWCGIDVVDSAAALGDRDIVLLAVPISAIAGVLESVSGASIVLHAGGLQRRAALGLTERQYDRLIGTHPIAGSHASGFAASRPDLFRGARVIIESRASADVRSAAETMWRLAGVTRFEYRDADSHDALVARMSHAPQLCATALAAALDDVQLDPLLTGPGARDTTRLAASDWRMWRDLLDGTPSDCIDALRAVENEVAGLRQALESRDLASVERTWRRAREWRTRAEGAA